MDIVRQLTLVYPVETFVFGADWVLQRATHMPAPDAKSKCNGLKSNLYKRKNVCKEVPVLKCDCILNTECFIT